MELDPEKRCLSLRDELAIDVPRRCGDCGYELTALPAAGKCPECGQDYREDELVLFGWPGRTRNPVARDAEHAWRGLMVWSVIGVSIVGALLFADRADDALLMAMIFGPIVTAYGILVDLEPDHPGPTQAQITADGIGQRDPLGSMRFRKWSPRHQLRIIQDAPARWRIAIQEMRLGVPVRSPVDVVIQSPIEPRILIQQIESLRRAGTDG